MYDDAGAGCLRLFELRHANASFIECSLSFFEIRRRRFSVSARLFDILASRFHLGSSTEERLLGGLESCFGVAD